MADQRINGVLAGSPFRVQLAETGEDVGRIVSLPPAGLEGLADAVLNSEAAIEVDEVSHAIVTFRQRNATREHRRSAIVALARVLENHRSLLEHHLMSGDEGALFHIANKFDLRHKAVNQQGDYDDAFLDWIFYWYLGTVQLIQRLLDRPGSTL